MDERTVIHYEYEGNYRDNVRLSLDYPLPRTEADLARQAANDQHRSPEPMIILLIWDNLSGQRFTEHCGHTAV